MPKKSKGQVAYELDCKLYPTFPDGTKRPSWKETQDFLKSSWDMPPFKIRQNWFDGFIYADEDKGLFLNLSGTDLTEELCKAGVFPCMELIARNSLQIIVTHNLRPIKAKMTTIVDIME